MKTNLLSLSDRKKDDRNIEEIPKISTHSHFP